jgi:NAD+ dependent glucose-6-phosphate dehydrogenase
MRVVVTGAAGHVAQRAVSSLLGRHDLLLTDLHVSDAMIDTGVSTKECDLVSARQEEIRQLFSDAEVVVHCAYIDSGGGDVYVNVVDQIDRFDIEFQNILMAQRVYRAALEAGVRRLVVASSNHAADWYEHHQLHYDRSRDIVGPSDYPLSDNFYGWSKAAYEQLAYPYASGTFGRNVEFVFLRIGSPYPVQPDRYVTEEAGECSIGRVARPSGRAGFKRALGAFLSDRDCAQLFQKAVEVDQVADERGVPWLVAYGISDNTRCFWSLASARKCLGYLPQDDSEVLYAESIRAQLTEPQSYAPDTGRIGS